jgi:serine/threonine-protein kinase RsbW
MPGAAWVWQCERSVDGQMMPGRKVLDEIVAQLKARRWDPADCYAVRLAIDEALVNAIRHGNRFDPQKRVAIRSWLSADLLRVEVHDQGAGFDPAIVPDPTAPDRIDLPHGRGLMLMRAFMSRVSFGDSGRLVILEKDAQKSP